MRCLILAAMTILGTAASAAPSYAQITQNNPDWEKRLGNYNVKTTGTVTAPVMSTYNLTIKVELQVNGQWQTANMTTVGGAGTGAAKNYDSGWLTVLTMPNNPPAGGSEYRVTVSGYYTLMGVRTDLTAVEKFVTVLPVP